MINTPQHDESIASSSAASAREDILGIMKLENISFFQKLDFTGSDYEERREKMEDLADTLIDMLYAEHLDKWNTFMHLRKEIIKNSADHSQSTMDVELKIYRDPHNKKTYIKFLFRDDGPGLPFDKEQISKIFVSESNIKKHVDTWEKKGGKNFGIGLGMIKAVTEVLPVDLILHNKGKMYHLKDIGFQSDVSAREDFGYEGLAEFDVVTK